MVCSHSSTREGFAAFPPLTRLDGVPYEHRGVTRQVSLEPYAEADADAIFSLIARNRAFFAEFDGPWPYRYQSPDDVISRMHAPDSSHRTRYSIRDETDAIVGGFNFQLHRVVEGLATIGYYVDQGHVQLGIASHALALVIAFASQSFGIDIIQAEINPRNLASVRTVQKNGLRRLCRHRGTQYDVFVRLLDQS